MSARSSASFGAALLGALLIQAPARADAYVVDGVVHVDGPDAAILDFAQTYPAPSPAYSARRGYPGASWYESWRLRGAHPAALDSRPCVLVDGWIATAASCQTVATPLEPLQPGFHRLHRRARRDP